MGTFREKGRYQDEYIVGHQCNLPVFVTVEAYVHDVKISISFI
jgi:hypothetical protein